MTVCNMSIEAGARAGMIAPDETTFAYLEGRPARPAGRRLGARARPLARAADRRRRGVRPRVEIDVDRARAAGHLGDEPRHGRAGHRTRSRPGRLRRPRRPRRRRARARLHGAAAGHGRSRTSRSTASSSARAPTRASRTCAPPPRSSPARSVADGGAGARRARARRRCAHRPRRKGSTGSSSTRASSGGVPAARCASA